MRVIMLALMMLISSNVFASTTTNPNDPVNLTQKCIKNSYSECGFVLPSNIKRGYKITNPCVVARIKECYCRYQGINC